MSAQAKILVADDDVFLRKFTLRALKAAGYETFGAQDGEEAIQLAHTHQPDLILMDVNMPNMDGLEALRRIKADPALASTYVIIISGTSIDSDSQVHGLKTGADGYLTRPLPDSELLAHVQAMLRIKAAEEIVRKQDLQLRNLIAGNLDGMLVVDGEGCVLFANPTACELLNRPAETIEGQIIDLPIMAQAPSELKLDSPQGGQRVVEMRVVAIEWHGQPAFLASLRDMTERKRAEDELHKKTERQSLLVEAGRELSRTLDLRQVSAGLYRILRQAVPCDTIFISHYDPETRLISCVSGWIDDNELDISALPPIPLEEEGHGTQSLVIRSRQALLLPDYETQNATAAARYFVDEDGQLVPEFALEEDRPRSAIILPLTWEEKVIGVLQVFSYRKAAHTEEHLLLLEPLALHTAAAMSNALLYQRAQLELAERKKAEETLRISEAALRQAQQVAHVGSWTWHIPSNRLEWSDEMYNIFGIQKDGFTGDLRDVIEGAIHPDDREAVERSNRAVADEKRPMPLEYRVVWPDGTVRVVWGEAGKLTVDEAGAPLRLTGIVQDITERKRAEAIQLENNATLKAILESAITPIFSLDRDYRYTGFNTAHATAMKGLYGVDIQLGHQLSEYQTVAEDWQAAKRNLDRALQGKLLVDSVFAGEPGPGRSYFEIVHNPIRIDTGEIIGVSVFANDITKRRQAEDILQAYTAHLEAEVAQRTSALHEAQEKLVRQERLAVMGQLAGSVGHELRNPLSVMNNAVYYLKLIQPAADGQVKEYLDILQDEIHTADKIITDLLDFSRIKSLERRPMAVSGVIRQVIERYPTPAGVQVTIDLPEDLPPVYADAQQMVQVLGNLVVNACQAMPEGGQLVIDSRLHIVDEGAFVAIGVRDSGVGIALENLSKLFEPLFTTRPRGIGLGLAICKKLIEANRGWIEVQSSPEAGSLFTVYLPVDGATQ